MRRTFLLIFLLITLFIVVTLQGDRFIVSPTSRIAPLDSTATFHCVVTGNHSNTVLQWLIDGDVYDTTPIMRRGIGATIDDDPVAGTLNSTLTVPATLENNMTSITCRIFPVAESPEVTLLIQGILAPPSNLYIGHVDDYNQKLTWTPPFTLNLTDVDPDITYNVCYNVTTNCTSTTDPYYVFPTPCDPVEFTVTAVNPVGENEPTSIVFDPIFTQRPTTMNMIMEKVSFQNITQPVVVFLFQIYGNCTGLYEAQFNGTYTGMVRFEPMVPTVNTTGIVNLTYTGLQPNDVYSGSIIHLISSDMVQETSFTTFDVQNYNSLEGRGGILSITCIFAEGSQAQGCVVIISLLGGEPPVVKRSEAFREQGSGNATASFTQLPSGTYSVVVLDIEEDGSKSRESPYEEFVITDGFVMMTRATSQTMTQTTVEQTTTPSPSDIVDVPPTEKDDAQQEQKIIIGVAVVGVIVIIVVAIIVLVKKNRGHKEINKQPTENGHEKDYGIVSKPQNHYVGIGPRSSGGQTASTTNHGVEIAEDKGSKEEGGVSPSQTPPLSSKATTDDGEKVEPDSVKWLQTDSAANEDLTDNVANGKDQIDGAVMFSEIPVNVAKTEKPPTVETKGVRRRRQ